jgi:predicted kinase
MWRTQPFLYTIVNRDKIRELLFGYTEGNIADYYKEPKIISFEKEVTKYQNVMISEALASGKTPIVDATHLSVKYLRDFAFWNVPVALVWFDINPGVAWNRVEKRTRKVSEEIIVKQYNQFATLQSKFEKEPELFDFTPVTMENDPSKPSCVIVDIDGTLAHMDFRYPYDWHRVGEDTVDKATKALVWDLYRSKSTKIIICTGRDGVCLPETTEWLNNHNIPYHGIFIRPAGDQRPDWQVKEEMWRKICQLYYIEYMIDDRQQVVRRARALGFKVMNVEYNNF